MLGDMRRQGNAQGRAAAEERARAQAQLSAPGLRGAARRRPPAVWPWTADGPPGAPARVARLCLPALRPVPACAHQERRRPCRPAPCLLAACWRRNWVQALRPPAASDAEALTACGARSSSSSRRGRRRGTAASRPHRTTPRRPRRGPGLLSQAPCACLRALQAPPFRPAASAHLRAPNAAGLTLGRGPVRCSTTSTSTGRRSTRAGRRRSTTAGRRRSTRRRRPGRRTARRRVGARRSSRRRRSSRPTRRRRSRRPGTPVSTRSPACGAGGERGRARCLPRCGGPGSLGPQPAQLQGAGGRRLLHVLSSDSAGGLHMRADGVHSRALASL